MRYKKICEKCEYFREGKTFNWEFSWEKEFGVMFSPAERIGKVLLYAGKETCWWCTNTHCKFLLEHSLIEWSKK